MYFDFSKGEAMYAEKFDQLLKEIERHGVGKAGQGVSAPSAGGDASTAALKKQVGEAEQMIKALQRQLQQATAGGVTTTSGTSTTAPSGSSELGQVMGKLVSVESKVTEQTTKHNDIEGKAGGTGVHDPESATCGCSISHM